MLNIGLNHSNIDEQLKKHGEFSFPVQVKIRNLSPLSIISTFSGVFLSPQGNEGSSTEHTFVNFQTLRNFITDMEYIARSHGFKELLSIEGLIESEEQEVDSEEISTTDEDTSEETESPSEGTTTRKRRGTR